MSANRDVLDAVIDAIGDDLIDALYERAGEVQEALRKEFHMRLKPGVSVKEGELVKRRQPE